MTTPTHSTGEVSSSSSAPPSAAESTQAATKTANQNAAAVTESGSGAGTFSSLGAFERKYPSFYKKFMNGFAQILINQIGDHNKRVIKTIKEYRQG